MDYLNYHGV
jgi:hypothetical protein